ncbi:MAG: MATE family efflux transporter [Burkholderiales bacterium]
MNRTTNMTEGRPLRLIVLFALPMFFSNIFQELYYVADSIIVGRIMGVNAFASVGAAGFYYWLVLSIIFGFSQGFGALFAQRFGAGDHEGLRRAIAQSVICTAALSALLTAASLLLLRPALVLVNTPAEVMDGAYTYLVWVLAAAPVMFAYNVCATLLRALGNSRTPLAAVIVSSVINIALDLLFVWPCGMGIAGSAIATVIANCCAFVYCLYSLKSIEAARITPNDFKHGRKVAGALIRLGCPLALRNIIIETGSILVQYVVNGYGTLYVAGVAAAFRYIGIMNLVGFSLDGAVMVYVGQNYGAGRSGRIKSGMRAARRLAIISSVITAALTALFGREMIKLFISGEVSEVAAVAEIGYRNLLAFSVCLPSLYMLLIYRSALQGMGNASAPMASGFIELVMRILSLFILPAFIGAWGVYFSLGAGWVAAAIQLVISYHVVFKKRFNAGRLRPLPGITY